VNVLAMLAAAGAVTGLWTGATKYRGATARGYRWLGVAALFWLLGLVIATFLAGQLSSSGAPLSLADVAPLLALAALAVGIMVLASGASPGSMAGLADGYVMAIALLVIGWVAAFGGEFHHSGERPETFLLNLLHPLTDLAVLGALLPVLTVAWHRVLLPYLSLLVLTGADSLGVGARISGGHEGILEQLAVIVAACLLGLAPWLDTIAARLARDSDADGAAAGEPAAGAVVPFNGPFGGRYVPFTSAGAATIIAAIAVVVAAFTVIVNGLASAPASGLALVIAGGAAVFVIAIRILMLVRENGVAIKMWRESGTSLRDLAVRTGDIMLLCDLDGVITYASPAVSGFSYPESELVGKALADFVHPEDLAAARGAITAALGAQPGGIDAGHTRARGTAGRFSCRVRAADGTWRHMECAVLLYHMPGEDARMLVTARDVSDQVALRQQVTHLTFHDGLTGLPNRAYVEERARDALAAADSQCTTGVIFLDLDGFTGVNDLVGHGAGDLVLAQAARRLRAAVPAEGTVARWGSDEFAVLIENAAGSQEVGELAERLAGVIAAEPFRAADRELRLTASVGVALADGSLPDVPSGPGGQCSQPPPENLLLRNADVAMARAKDNGGGRVEVYAAHMHADVVRRLDLASDLQRALDNEELTLQYQPVVELATSRVTGAEALVRWWRGDELVPPREFLAVAEESGMVVALGGWVLREACAQGAAWRASAWDVGVSVNLSLRQLNAPQAVARVAEVLRDTGLPPAALTIEVNERVLVEGAGLVTGRLAELRDLGVRLAIDDFGTGYASLAHLRQLPVDIIKIDPSFVAGLGTDPTVTMLTKTIVQVGRDLGIEVVAEGIEQPRQMTELREMGCGYGQGFLVARPMAAPGVEALIRTSARKPKPGVPAA
jgi:diguanylate cyclase (GGDEF)-like protein/PAS domain S-box-containing protein